jgi:hypothetical protein
MLKVHALKLSCVIQGVPFVHHHRFRTKTTPLDVGKLLCLTSLVIFFVISSDNCLWKKLCEMRLDFFH